MNNLRYADDTTLIAKSEEEMARLLERVAIERNNLGLEINVDKTKLVLIDRSNTIRLPNLPNIEIVNKFTYLCSLIINTGGCEAEIRKRIAMSRSALTNLRKIWTDRDITKTPKDSCSICGVFIFWKTKITNCDSHNVTILQT